MFGRTSSNAKKAYEALQQGRLDEAVQLVLASGVPSPALGEPLATELCDALLRRAQEHLIVERFSEALFDIERAARCGVNAPKVEEWRQRAMSAMQDRQRQKRQQRQAIEAAQDGIAAGELTLAKDHLAVAGGAVEAGALAQMAERQAERARTCLADARAALGRGDIMAAVESWMQARRNHPGSDEAPVVELDICRAAVAQAREGLASGRLDRARAVLGQLGDVGRGRPERTEAQQALSLAEQAAGALEAGRRRDADILLGRLAQIVPQAKWIAGVREHVRSLDAAFAAVAEGPLGFLLSAVNPRPSAAPAVDETLVVPPLAVKPPPVIVGTELSSRLLLRIDGVGSYLVLRGDRVSIGRGGPGALADVPIMADLPERAADVIRTGEDYFLISSGVEATVSGQPARQALLSHGDKVALGRRARFTFLRPSRKSATAVLELASDVRCVTDVRRIILLGGPLLLGATGECHVSIPGANLVLSERGGKLTARALIAPGVSGGAMTPIAIGQVVEIGGVRLSVQPWSATSGIGRVVG